MNFKQTPEFQKDLKRLGKKWRSLPTDITDAQRSLIPLYVPQPGVDILVLRQSFFGSKHAAILHQTSKAEVVKMRLDVSDLGTKDKVRMIFIAVKTDNEIIFVELYAKDEKLREDPARYRRIVEDL